MNATDTLVSVEKRGDVAVVTIAHAPVNALAAAVRAGLLQALEDTEADTSVRAVVLTGAGRSFSAGADIAEFGRPPVAPLLPDVIAAVEGATRPWIAAINGAALGGGLELALGCHWRIAAPGAQLGLPEVTLGLIPGAGGTVRLPRLVAPAEAVVMVAGGKPVSAARAAELTLVDAVAEGDLMAAALRLAAEAAERPRPPPLLARPPPTGPDADFEAAATRLLARAGGQVAPEAAVAAVRDALTMPAAEALAAERRRFVALRDGPQSAALRHVFAAERAAGKPPARPDAPWLPNVLPTAQIGIVGGGTMGAGIATAALLAGRDVMMLERDTAALERGLRTVRGHLEGARARGLIDTAGLEAHRARLSGDTVPSALGDADLVIEAVFEDMEVKRAVFAGLDKATRPEAILATNTSYLDVDRIAAVLRDPGRALGLHFFAPAHAMKLVEVIRTRSVRAEVLATALAFARDLRKVPVVSGVCDGFIGNRILTRYRQATDILLLEGALPWEVDAAMEGFGMAMGPYAVQDLSGLEIAHANRARLGLKHRPDWRYVPIADRMVTDLGRLGRKSGAGWYDYPDGAGREPSREVEALILDASREAGIVRHGFDAAEIRARALAAMVAEAAHVLEDGVANRPGDIDLVMIHGYGFPRWRGGPLHHADREGLAAIVARLEAYAAQDPVSWRVPDLVRRLATQGRDFGSLAEGEAAALRS